MEIFQTEHMKFLEDEIVKGLLQEPGWTDDTMTIFEFYHTNPVLWNHCLRRLPTVGSV